MEIKRDVYLHKLINARKVHSGLHCNATLSKRERHTSLVEVP